VLVQAATSRHELETNRKLAALYDYASREVPVSPEDNLTAKSTNYDAEAGTQSNKSEDADTLHTDNTNDKIITTITTFTTTTSNNSPSKNLNHNHSTMSKMDNNDDDNEGSKSMSGVMIEGEPPHLEKKTTTLPEALKHYHAKSRESFLDHWKNVFKKNDEGLLTDEEMHLKN
jgi:hypothetical protein